MNNRQIGRKVKKILRDMKRERKRCAKEYPDWCDDEYNNLDDKFIWGCTSSTDNQPSSFNHWDDAYVYYNRKTKKYYMVIDTGFYSDIYDEEVAQEEIDRLDRIESRFSKFLIQNHIPCVAYIFPFQNPALEADTLSELYVKLRVMIEGYRAVKLYKVANTKGVQEK